jgi:asparagine synthase (glutamine-hydrolysing)
MCGIVGIYEESDAPGEAPEALGRRMLERLSHRGPDGEGEASVGDAWLGHRRLSIVDLEGGAQPLHTRDRSWWLVGNGELYNHARVREDLADADFRTASDNEVALHLIDGEGPAALSRLRGMYAFFASSSDGDCIAARDPVGVKPLFWARRDGLVVFASEVKAFDREWQPDVELFPPGHYWAPEEGLTEFRAPVSEDLAYVAQVDPPKAPGSPVPNDLRRLIRDSLVSAVEREMMADVPVGIFLSGGLDSSLIAAIAARSARRRGQTLHTFAVGTADSPDLAAASRVAAELGTEHHERVYQPEELRRLLPDVIRSIESYDPSLVRSALPNYLLADLAAQSVKVVLTGEGADELFAGYEYVRAIADHGELHDELVRTIEELHSLNLQRCDRVTMAHGLEARVPFLDLDMIAVGVALPAEWKLAGPGQAEKRLLREAFAGWLPEEILWREKAQFGDGSGARDALEPEGGEGRAPDELHAAIEPDAVGEPRTEEEARYLALYRERYPDVAPERTMSLFATA